jgi:hypothetical protein
MGCAGCKSLISANYRSTSTRTSSTIAASSEQYTPPESGIGWRHLECKPDIIILHAWHYYTGG